MHPVPQVPIYTPIMIHRLIKRTIFQYVDLRACNRCDVRRSFGGRRMSAECLCARRMTTTRMCMAHQWPYHCRFGFVRAVTVYERASLHDVFLATTTSSTSCRPPTHKCIVAFAFNEQESKSPPSVSCSKLAFSLAGFSCSNEIGAWEPSSLEHSLFLCDFAAKVLLNFHDDKTLLEMQKKGQRRLFIWHFLRRIPPM